MPFTDVVGLPDEFFDSLGRITFSFGYIEDEVSNAIVKLTKTNKKIGNIIVAELSFKNKLNLLGSLFHFYNKTHNFNSFFANQEETFGELLKACFKCEELRNQILHSSFEFNSGEILRKKITAKAKNGLKTINEKIDSGYLLNVADYIYETGAHIEEFFYVVEKKIKP